MFVLVFLVSHQLSTSAITLWRYILFFNIVFFCKRQLSPTKQSHLLKWLKWKQYFLWIPMFAREHLSTLPLNSHFNFTCSNSFFFCSVPMICNLQLWVFCLTWWKYLLCCYRNHVVTDPPPETWDKQVSASLFLSDQELGQDYLIHWFIFYCEQRQFSHRGTFNPSLQSTRHQNQHFTINMVL